MKKQSLNSDSLFEHLENIDEDLLMEALEIDNAKKLKAISVKTRSVKTWLPHVATVAACLLLVVGIVFASARILPLFNIGNLPAEDTTSPTAPPPVINPPIIDDSDVVIDSIDKLNYYGAMYILGEKVNEKLSNPQTQEETVALASTGGTYYYRLNRDTVYTISEVIYFQIELTNEFGFLASKVGLGTVDVVITKNNLDQMEYMITFKNGDRYYSCLLNNYSQTDHTMVFSTHKYIDGLYLVKDMSQANYSFRFQFNPKTYRILQFTCDYYRTTVDTYYPLQADPILEYSSTFTQIKNVDQSFTLEDLAAYFGKPNEFPKDFEEGDLEFTSNRDGTCYVSGTGDCTATTIVVPERAPNGDIVTAIGPNAFSYSTLCENVILPSTVKTIRFNAFWKCTYLKSITLPEGLTTIEEYAFQECEYLSSIEVPDSVIKIGMGAFKGCYRLERVKLPKHLTILEAGMFENCYQLLQVEMPTNLRVIEHSAFVSCWELPSIEIPEGVVQIGGNAFRDCMSLIALHFPSTVENISFPIFTGCDKLQTLSVAEGNPHYYSRDNCLIDKEWNELYAVCRGYVIPSDGSVTRIHQDAFAGLLYSDTLYDIVIPEGVEMLGAYLFQDSMLRSVSIPSTVYYMTDLTFAMYINSNLKTVNYNGTKERWEQIADPIYWAVGTGITVHCTDGDLVYQKEK